MARTDDINTYIDINTYVDELTQPVDTIVLGRELAEGFIRPGAAGVRISVSGRIVPGRRTG